MRRNEALLVELDGKDGVSLWCTAPEELDGCPDVECLAPGRWRVRSPGRAWEGNAFCDAHRALLTDVTEVAS